MSSAFFRLKSARQALFVKMCSLYVLAAFFIDVVLLLIIFDGYAKSFDGKTNWPIKGAFEIIVFFFFRYILLGISGGALILFFKKQFSAKALAKLFSSMLENSILIFMFFVCTLAFLALFGIYAYALVGPVSVMLLSTMMLFRMTSYFNAGSHLHRYVSNAFVVGIFFILPIFFVSLYQEDIRGLLVCYVSIDRWKFEHIIRLLWPIYYDLVYFVSLLFLIFIQARIFSLNKSHR